MNPRPSGLKKHDVERLNAATHITVINLTVAETYWKERKKKKNVFQSNGYSGFII